MQTHTDIIAHLGGYRKVAAICGVKPGTASSWLSRGSIPPEHWSDIVSATNGAVSWERLAELRPSGRVRGAQ